MFRFPAPANVLQITKINASAVTLSFVTVYKNNDENYEEKKAKIKCFREVIKVMTFKSLKSDDLKFKEIRHTALSCFSTSVASSFV